MRVAATVVLALLAPLTSAAALSARPARRAEPEAAGHILAADGASHVDETPLNQLVSGTAANDLSGSGVAVAEIDSAAAAAAAGHATQGDATQSIDEQKCSPEVLKACQENSGQVEPLGCVLCMGHLEETTADPNGVSLVDHKGGPGVGLARATASRLKKIGPKKTGPKKTGPKKTVPKKTVPKKTVPKKTVPKKKDDKKHDKKKGDDHRLEEDEPKGIRGRTRNGSVRHGGSTRGGRGGSVGRQRGGHKNDNHRMNSWEHGLETGSDAGWKDGRKHDRHSSRPVRKQQQQRQRLSSRDIQADAARRTSVMDVRKGGLKKGGLKKGGPKKASSKKVGRDVDKRDSHEVSQAAGQAEASKRPTIKKAGTNGLKKAVQEKLQGKKAA